MHNSEIFRHNLPIYNQDRKSQFFTPIAAALLGIPPTAAGSRAAASS